MRSDSHAHPAGEKLADRVLEKTSVDVARCYQCGKCSAGCPLAADMDFPPSQIMHLLQLREFPGIRGGGPALAHHLAVPDLRDLFLPLPHGTRYSQGDGRPAP